MSTKVYFLSTTKLKTLTTINPNVDDNLLTMAIWDSQEIHTQPILGTDLYKKLKTDVGTGTVTGVYKTLLDDYVIPALVQWSVSEALIYLRYKIMNKSISSQASDNTTPADLDELKFISSEIKNRAQFYDQRMIDYLCQYSSSYPEYSSNSTLDDIQPVGTSYFCGIQLDDTDPSKKLIGFNDGIVILNKGR